MTHMSKFTICQRLPSPENDILLKDSLFAIFEILSKFSYEVVYMPVMGETSPETCNFIKLIFSW